MSVSPSGNVNKRKEAWGLCDDSKRHKALILLLPLSLFREGTILIETGMQHYARLTAIAWCVQNSVGFPDAGGYMKQKPPRSQD